MLRRFVLAAAAAVALSFASVAAALQVTPLDERLVSVELTSSAASEPEALQAAKVQAVMASAGRILLEDKLFRADELMQKYISNYAERFVQGVEVLDDRFIGGKTVLDARVFVDYQTLVTDLEEKKFLYSPAYKPMFTLFIEERLEGVRLDQPGAQQLLQNALQLEGLKPYGGQILEPPTTVDVAEEPVLLQAALVAAERRNIEYVISGTCRTDLREQSQMYYDPFFFYDTVMEVQVVRVDTGEVFFETEARDAAASRDQAQAISTAIARASTSVAEDIEGAFRAFWPEVVQAAPDRVDYEILLTATDEELTRIVSESFKRLGPETTIHLKKSFDRSAVLTLSTDAGRADVLEVIKSTSYPTLRIVGEPSDRKFEVQVAG